MRIIDADALMEQTQFRLPLDNYIAEIYDECVKIHRENIEEAPTIDAVPVKELEALVDFFYIDGCISKRYLTMLHGLIDMHKRKDGDE